MPWVVNVTPRPLYPWERPGTHCTGGWVGPGPVWMGAENLGPTRIRSPDRPARSESSYRLSYPGPQNTHTHTHTYIIHTYIYIYIYILQLCHIWTRNRITGSLKEASALCYSPAISAVLSKPPCWLNSPSRAAVPGTWRKNNSCAHDHVKLHVKWGLRRDEKQTSEYWKM